MQRAFAVLPKTGGGEPSFVASRDFMFYMFAFTLRNPHP
jgi:hypothetical protein